MIKKFFKYIEPLWTGPDNKISVRSSLGIAFSINFMYNLSHAIYKWEVGRPLEGLALVLGIEAGLIAAFFTLTTYQNIAANNVANAQPKIDVNEGRTVNTTTTKAEVVNAAKVDTVNTQNTTITDKHINLDN